MWCLVVKERFLAICAGVRCAHHQPTFWCNYLQAELLKFPQALCEGCGKSVFVVDDGADFFVFFTVGEHVADVAQGVEVFPDGSIVFRAEFLVFQVVNVGGYGVVAFFVVVRTKGEVFKEVFKDAFTDGFMAV